MLGERHSKQKESKVGELEVEDSMSHSGTTVVLTEMAQERKAGDVTEQTRSRQITNAWSGMLRTWN